MSPFLPLPLPVRSPSFPPILTEQETEKARGEEKQTNQRPPIQSGCFVSNPTEPSSSSATAPRHAQRRYRCHSRRPVVPSSSGPPASPLLGLLARLADRPHRSDFPGERELEGLVVAPQGAFRGGVLALVGMWFSVLCYSVPLGSRTGGGRLLMLASLRMLLRLTLINCVYSAHELEFSMRNGTVGALLLFRVTFNPSFLSKNSDTSCQSK